MADNKYGRIFTEDDVRNIAKELLGDSETGPDRLAEVLANFKGRFPQEEPLFILRAKDRYAAGTVRNYWMLCQSNNKIPGKHIDIVEESLRQFDQYKIDNPNAVRLPD